MHRSRCNNPPWRYAACTAAGSRSAGGCSSRSPQSGGAPATQARATSGSSWKVTRGRRSPQASGAARLPPRQAVAPAAPPHHGSLGVPEHQAAAARLVDAAARGQEARVREARAYARGCPTGGRPRGPSSDRPTRLACTEHAACATPEQIKLKPEPPVVAQRSLLIEAPIRFQLQPIRAGHE